MSTQINNVNLAHLDEKMSELLEYVAFPPTTIPIPILRA